MDRKLYTVGLFSYSKRIEVDNDIVCEDNVSAVTLAFKPQLLTTKEKF
jgi:hypothetical protein